MVGRRLRPSVDEGIFGGASRRGLSLAVWSYQKKCHRGICRDTIVWFFFLKGLDVSAALRASVILGNVVVQGTSLEISAAH